MKLWTEHEIMDELAALGLLAGSKPRPGVHQDKHASLGINNPSGFGERAELLWSYNNGVGGRVTANSIGGALEKARVTIENY